jgi:hypothetical protein
MRQSAKIFPTIVGNFEIPYEKERAAAAGLPENT